MLNDLFASVYELGGLIWFPEFTTQMFTLGQYGPAGITMLIIVIVVLGIVLSSFWFTKIQQMVSLASC
jgi:hypothetical protein